MKKSMLKKNDPVYILGVFFLLIAGLSMNKEEWRTLFNGKNFDGWEYRGGGDAPPTFDIEEGTIVGRTLIPYNNSAFMCTKEQFKDFELIFEIKIDEDLNSGVQLRSTPEGTVRGAQIEIESGSSRTGYIFGQGMGMWLSEDFPEKNEAFKKNEWNRFRAVVRGQNIKTWINDIPVADITHEKVAPEGVIGLQVHAYPRGKKREQGAKEILSVAWRNIKIRELN